MNGNVQDSMQFDRNSNGDITGVWLMPNGAESVTQASAVLLTTGTFMAFPAESLDSAKAQGKELPDMVKDRMRKMLRLGLAHQRYQQRQRLLHV